jgi:hypothetical protein
MEKTLKNRQKTVLFFNNWWLKDIFSKTIATVFNSSRGVIKKRMLRMDIRFIRGNQTHLEFRSIRPHSNICSDGAFLLTLFNILLVPKNANITKNNVFYFRFILYTLRVYKKLFCGEYSCLLDV